MYAASSELHVDAVAADQIDATAPVMRLPSACCTGCYEATTWSQRCKSALPGVRRRWPSCGRFQCHGRNSPARSTNQATLGLERRMPSSVARQFSELQATGSRCEGPTTHRAPGPHRSQQPRNSLAGSDQPPITSRVVSPGQTVRVKSTGLPRRSS